MVEDEKVSVKIQAAIEQGQVKEIYLIFSPDGGSNWFEVQMEPAEEGYIVEIPNVNIGTQITYCFKAIDHENAEIIEDNDGQYYIEIAKSNQPKTDAIAEESTKANKEAAIETPKSPFPSASSTNKRAEQGTGAKLEIPKIQKPEIRIPKGEASKIKGPKLEIPKIEAPKIEIPKMEKERELSNKQKEKREEPPQEKTQKIEPPRLKKPKIYPPKVVKHGNIREKPKEFGEKKEIQNPFLQNAISQPQIREMPKQNAAESSLPPEFSQKASEKFQDRPEPETKIIPHTNKIDADKPIESEKTKMTSTPLKLEVFKDDNPNLPQPIVATNPFSIDAGNITGISQPMQSFSQIIKFKKTSKPDSSQAKGTMSKKMVRQCSKCQAILAKKWKICAVCGDKN